MSLRVIVVGLFLIVFNITQILLQFLRKIKDG